MMRMAMCQTMLLVLRNSTHMARAAARSECERNGNGKDDWQAAFHANEA